MVVVFLFVIFILVVLRAGQCTSKVCSHFLMLNEALVVNGYLLQQRQQDGRGVVADVRGHAHHALEEAAAQRRLLLVVQERHHVRQDHVVC